MASGIHGFGAIMTRLALGGTQDPWGVAAQPEGGAKIEVEIDHIVMETKLKIIEILEFIMNVRLDYRISTLLTIFKRDFDESNANMGDLNAENGTFRQLLCDRSTDQVTNKQTNKQTNKSAIHPHGHGYAW